jgi:hypothetical protein
LKENKTTRKSTSLIIEINIEAVQLIKEIENQPAKILEMVKVEKPKVISLPRKYYYQGE